MELAPQEIPLILTLSLGAVGAGFIGFYRNYLCTKEPCSTIQAVYAWANIASAIVFIASKLTYINTLFWLNWVLTGFMVTYTVASFFTDRAQTASLIAWSDFFLLSLYWFFYALQLYASILLTYQRARKPKIPKSITKSVPKEEDLDFYDDPKRPQRTP